MLTTSNAAIYGRADALVELHEQIDACKKHAQAQGYELKEDHIYKTLNGNPLSLELLLDLLDAADQGAFTVLIVTRRDRLHQDAVDVRILVALLARSYVTVEEVSHATD